MDADERPTTLRKACHHCIAAKRRCIVNLPRCARCSKKGLQCSYDLEPLAAATREEQPPPCRGGRVGGAPAAHCLLQRLSAMGEDQDQPEPPIVSRHEDREGIEYVIWVLRLVPSFVMRKLPSVFIHPKLRWTTSRTTEENPLDVAVDEIGNLPNIGPRHKRFQDLVRVDHGHDAPENFLSAVQALMLYLVSFMFCCDADVQEAARPYFTHLLQWTDDLEMRAQNITTKGLSPWQGWLFGESTRRTILTAHIFTCIFFRHQYEPSANKVRMEALPFDARIGLWQAETPQAWIAAAGERRGQDVKTELVSWHEFSTGCPTISMETDGDMFLSMMLVSHNGRSSLSNDV